MGAILIDSISELKDIQDQIYSCRDLILRLNVKSKTFPEQIIKALELRFQHPIIVKDKKSVYILLYVHVDEMFGIRKYDRDEYDETYIQLKNLVKNSTKGTDVCSIVLRLDRNLVEYLKETVNKKKYLVSGGKLEQREVSGKLKINQTINKNNLLVSLEEGSTKIGDKEESDYVETFASFHTHPLSAYIKHGFVLTFPSVDDYFTFFNVYVDNAGAFHLVASVEGIYLMTLSDHIMSIPREELKKNMKEYKKKISAQYQCEYPKSKKDNKAEKIKEYIRHINSKPYFKVKFISWKKAYLPISIDYKGIGENCVISDEQISLTEFYKEVGFDL